MRTGRNARGTSVRSFSTKFSRGTLPLGQVLGPEKMPAGLITGCYVGAGLHRAWSVNRIFHSSKETLMMYAGAQSLQ